MADFLEDVLSNEEPAAPAPEPAPTPEPVTEQLVEALSEPEQVSPVPDPKPSEDKAVPLPTFLDMRDRARELERQLESERRSKVPDQTQVPDPLDDPSGYTAYLNQQLEARVAQERFGMSDVMARQAHGAETVESAVQWANERAANDPSFAMSYMREAHPIDWIVRQHKQSSLLSDIGDNVDDWFSREAVKRGYVSSAAPVAAAPIAAVQQAPRPAAPPRSIASDTSASAPVVTDQKADFEAIFNGR